MFEDIFYKYSEWYGAYICKIENTDLYLIVYHDVDYYLGFQLENTDQFFKLTYRYVGDIKTLSKQQIGSLLFYLKGFLGINCSTNFYLNRKTIPFDDFIQLINFELEKKC